MTRLLVLSLLIGGIALIFTHQSGAFQSGGLSNTEDATSQPTLTSASGKSIPLGAQILTYKIW